MYVDVYQFTHYPNSIVDGGRFDKFHIETHHVFAVMVEKGSLQVRVRLISELL